MQFQDLNWINAGERLVKQQEVRFNNKSHCAWVNASKMWISPAGTKSFTATADGTGKAKATFSATAISNGGGINGAGDSSMMAVYKLTVE